MAFKDPHDKRRFQRFAQVDDTGAIVAIVEVAEGKPAPDGRFIHFDVTDQLPRDTAAIVVPQTVLIAVAENAIAIKVAVDAHAAQQAAAVLAAEQAAALAEQVFLAAANPPAINPHSLAS